MVSTPKPILHRMGFSPEIRALQPMNMKFLFNRIFDCFTRLVAVDTHANQVVPQLKKPKNIESTLPGFEQPLDYELWSRR